MFGFLKKKPKRTMLDEFDSTLAGMYRPYLSQKKNTTDAKIVEIVQMVMTAFKQAAESKGESISGTVLVNISTKFIKVYDLSDEEFFLEHLKYELTLYLSSGLRDDYL
jgi:hypothetical protein